MDNIIPIKSEDIIENLDSILQHSNLFQTNSNLESLCCYIFYVENKKLLHFKKYEIQVNENKLSRKELLAMVLKNNKHHSKKFDLTGIYKFEVALEEKKIKDFCQNPQEFQFLSQYHNIQDIPFQPCIEIFNENNCVLLFFSRQVEEPEPEPEHDPSQEACKDGKVPKIMTQKNKTQKKVKFNLDKPISTLKKETNKTMKSL